MERIRENLIKESLMNIRFLAQSEYFNGIHIKDDIILEKEYEQGRFTNLPRVRYYLYYLEENVRKEVMPHSEKVDVFELTDCQYEPEYLYFTEIDDMLDGRQTEALNTGKSLTYSILLNIILRIILIQRLFHLKTIWNCILTRSRLRFLFWMTLI